MTDFFISYTQADREWARWIKAVLIAAGYSVRLQADDFPPGSNFAFEMQKAVTECRKTLAVLSTPYLTSDFGAAEWLAAFVRDPTGKLRKLVPVRVEAVEPPGFLAGIVHIDLVGLGEAAAQAELLVGLAKGAGQPQEGSIFPGAPSSPFPGPSASPPGVDEARTRLHGLPLGEIPRPAPLPAGSRMPHAVNPMFVGRDEDLRVLARALKVGESAAIGQFAAATGLGGIGKTQLASEFVHRYGQFFEGGVFWMSFADSAGVPAEVAACGRHLGLHPQFEELPLERQVQLVRDSWLSPLPRLLVFDNCEEQELLQEWRPTTGRARVLLTSRRARWDPVFGIHSHALETLSRPASIELVRRFRPDLPADDSALEEIAQELGDLPLALHLAGSFLQRYRHTGFGQPKAYLEELRRGDLLDHPSLRGVRADLIPTSHDAHVARTFALSYEQLDPEDRVDALAQQLLVRASYFAPGEPIPRDLLTATLGTEDSSVPSDVEEALGRLIDLGLLEEGKDGRVVMHRLVVQFAKREGHEGENRFAVEAALYEESKRLNKAGYPGVIFGWQSHLRFVAEEAWNREDEIAADLCHSLAFHLSEIGDDVGAELYLNRALAIREKILGPEHPDTATSLNNLANCLQNLGDISGARSHHERALAIREKVLGPEHPDTVGSLNNLGHLLQELGDLAGARPYYERALAISEKVLSPEHPDTATILNNLGSLLQDLGDLSGARSHYERALALCKKVQGPEHPQTAFSLNNLGTLLQDQGDLSGARSYFQRALTIRKKVLGPEHPYTKITQQNLENLLKELSGPDSLQE